MHPFSPLLHNDNGKSEDDSPQVELSSHGNSPTFPLRIKLNNTDYTLNVNKSVSVATLKEWILDCHRSAQDGRNIDTSGHYLRLIVRGRLMAPDTATLDAFNVNDSDVVHAVLAKEGRGAQARMLRRLNNGTGNNGGNNTNTAGINLRRNLYSNPTDSESLTRLWRRIGIDASGVVVSREQGESESEESEVEGDVEAGEGRVGRERRGFDRLRSVRVLVSIFGLSAHLNCYMYLHNRLACHEMRSI